METSSTERRAEWEALVSTGVNGSRELDAVSASLVALQLDRPDQTPGYPHLYVELHGALLLFQVAGEAAMLPTVGFAPFGERALQRRITAAARRLAGKERGPEASFAAWCRAGDKVTEYIGLIDPELLLMVA